MPGDASDITGVPVALETAPRAPVVLTPPGRRLVAGTRLGPFEIVERLGAGGMGEVFRAHDTRLRRDVAVKVIAPGLLIDSAAVARFDLEARAAAAVSHPNVRAIHDVGHVDGHAFVVCELLEGVTLRDRIAGGPMPVKEALDVARQIAEGLAAAHAQGVVHRDLKPENVFLTGGGPVKIVDFGLAKLNEPSTTLAADTLTGEGAILGTTAYMSPEQLRGASVDARSDLFSLGIVLHEMLAGTRPFTGAHTADLMASILREAPTELPPTIPPAVARVVERCLEKVRERRFQSAGDLAFALEQTRTNASTTSQVVPPRPARALPRPGVRRAVIAAVVVAAAAVAVAAVVALLLRHPEAPHFRRLSFRRGDVWSARFSPDGAIYYENTVAGRQGAAIYRVRPEDPESRALGMAGTGLLAVSPTGELAVRLNPNGRGRARVGILGRVSPEGGMPREVTDDVSDADFPPDGGELAVVRVLDGWDRVEHPIGVELYRTLGRIDDMRFSPDGSRIAFSESPLENKRARLVILDRHGKLLRATPVYHDLYGLAWSPRGELWFTASDAGMNRSLRALTDDGDRELLRIPARLTLLDVGRDGRVLLLRVSWRAAAMWHGAAAAGDRDLSWFDHSYVSDLSSDGSRLLLRELGDAGGARHRTYLRPTDGGDAVWLGEGAGLALSPDGSRVLVGHPDQPAELEVLPTETGTPRRIAPGRLAARLNAGWFPDGRHIAYTGVEPDGAARRAYVQDLDGEPRAITPPGWFVESPRSVSPDGSRIVIHDAAREDLFLVDAEGGTPVPIAGVTGRDRFAGWRGTSILVIAGGMSPRVFAVDPATGTRTELAQLAPTPDELNGVTDFRMADDGSYAYTRVTHTSELYLVTGIE